MIKEIIIVLVCIIAFLSLGIDFGSKTIELNKENFIQQYEIDGGDMLICKDKIYIERRKFACFSSWMSDKEIIKNAYHYGLVSLEDVVLEEILD